MNQQRFGRNDPSPCGSGRKYKLCCSHRGFAGNVPNPARRHDGATLTLIRPRSQPKARQAHVRCLVNYRFEDGFGIGEVSYGFNRGQLFLLTDRRVVKAERLQPGMHFFLEDGALAMVTDVQPPKVWEPPPAGVDNDGVSIKKVRGTVKYSGHYPVLDLRVGGQTIRTTSGHPFYSRTRKGWVDAGTLRIGECLQDKAGRSVSVEEVGRPTFGYVELFNLEVEDFHTYFVGKGEGAVWSHNGLEAGCRIPKPMAAEALERGVVSPTTAARAGVTRPPRHHVFPQQHRAWFEQRGVDIDRYTLPLDEGTHQALHYGGGPGKGGGFWNETVMQRLLDAEAAKGQPLTKREILMIGKQMRDQYTPGLKVIGYDAP